MKLNLGCGFEKFDDYVGMDVLPQVNPDIVWNMSRTPWPFKDNSFEEIRCMHVFEHIPQPHWSEIDPIIRIFDEAWRVLEPGGIFHFIIGHPNVSRKASGLLTYRPFTPYTFEGFYLDREITLAANEQHHVRYLAESQYDLISYQINRGYPLYQFARKRGIFIHSDKSHIRSSSFLGNLLHKVDMFLHWLKLGPMYEMEWKLAVRK